MRGRAAHASARWCLQALILLAIGGRQVALAADSAIRIAEGKGRFVFTDTDGDPSKRTMVYTYLPRGVDPATARIVFTMHGVSRRAEAMRDDWIEAAEREHLMIVAPLFDRQQWGGGAYASPSVIDRAGHEHDPATWSFSVVEHLFDAIRIATHNGTPRYYLYGHSEGGQFVHRLVLLLPQARYARAIAANAGWYTMPTFDVAYPFGLGGAPVDDASLRTSLGRDVVVLLGERDVDPNHKQLNRTPSAMAQGAYRLERGKNFFSQAKARAEALGTPFGWRLQTVPGVAHQNGPMSRAAIGVLLDPERDSD